MRAKIFLNSLRFFTLASCLFGVFLLVVIQARLASAQTTERVLASKTISLANRYPNKAISDIFRDNILLTASYLQNKTEKGKPDWNDVAKSFTYDFSLKSGETFAFHDSGMLPEYAKTVVKTTNAHYNGSEGFKSDGYLMGDGVCHFASLLYWAAKDAGIEATAPVNHDFANIPEIDKKYGVAIYADPNSSLVSAQQNLYIRNNQSEAITFRISYNGSDLSVQVLKQS